MRIAPSLVAFALVSPRQCYNHCTKFGFDVAAMRSSANALRRRMAKAATPRPAEERQRCVAISNSKLSKASGEGQQSDTGHIQAAGLNGCLGHPKS